jgi:hypothetical protein
MVTYVSEDRAEAGVNMSCERQNRSIRLHGIILQHTVRSLHTRNHRYKNHKMGCFPFPIRLQFCNSHCASAKHFVLASQDTIHGESREKTCDRLMKNVTFGPGGGVTANK